MNNDQAIVTVRNKETGEMFRWAGSMTAVSIVTTWGGDLFEVVSFSMV